MERELPDHAVAAGNPAVSVKSGIFRFQQIFRRFSGSFLNQIAGDWSMEETCFPAFFGFRVSNLPVRPAQ
jgi:hypothetical protein